MMALAGLRPVYVFGGALPIADGCTLHKEKAVGRLVQPAVLRFPRRQNRWHGPCSEHRVEKL
jgi:hypothetical protein